MRRRVRQLLKAGMAYLDHPSSHPWNPLHGDDTARGLSSYLGTSAGRLRPMLAPQRPCSDEEMAAHAETRQKIMSQGFPCVAARSVMNRQTYRWGLYPELGTRETALALCHDLYEFSHEWGQGQAPFTSFIAAFKGPLHLTEATFETLLWQQLQFIHDIDARHFDWDATVSQDPNDAKFSFSVGGRAFFVIGMHPGASRLARTVAQPCLVFNPHAQFEALRADGSYEKLQSAIRQRDISYQGSVNPVLTNFGQQAETRQYSGRAVPAHWQCPFQPKTKQNPHS